MQFIKFSNTTISVEAIVEIPEDFDCKKDNTPTINWDCCGSVSIAQAKKFVTILNKAIARAQEVKIKRSI